VNLADFSVRNRDTGATLSALAIPEALLSIMRGGGIFPLLEKQGLIEPAAT
jgi:hypothetical protein